MVPPLIAHQVASRVVALAPIAPVVVVQAAVVIPVALQVVPVLRIVLRGIILQRPPSIVVEQGMRPVIMDKIVVVILLAVVALHHQ